nr:hypothetical protein [Tanacetum cinerariifolium]
MTSAEQTPTLRTVVIPFTQLQDNDDNLLLKIEQGFGPDGLGILSIYDVPGYVSLRQNLLNLALDKPTTKASFIERYPAYRGSNIWPQSNLPELEVAFKALGKIIFEVGLLVAYHCDKYVSKEIDVPPNEGIE